MFDYQPQNVEGVHFTIIEMFRCSATIKSSDVQMFTLCWLDIGHQWLLLLLLATLEGWPQSERLNRLFIIDEIYRSLEH